MTTHMREPLTGARIDRAAGVLLGTACGDALGARGIHRGCHVLGGQEAMVSREGGR